MSKPIKKVYLASNFEERFRLRLIRARLAGIGTETTSRWLDIAKCYPTDAQYRIDSARMDVEDINRCDLLIAEMFSINRPQHGKHFELGYALAAGKQCWVVGDDFHIFHDLVHKKLDSIESAVGALGLFATSKEVSNA